METSEETIKFRPLGEAKNIVERIGLDISYVHDDLIFVEHSAFMLRFDDENNQNLFLHFNENCNTEDSIKIEKQLTKAAGPDCFSITKDKAFSLEQIEGKEEIQIHFLE